MRLQKNIYFQQSLAFLRVKFTYPALPNDPQKQDSV
jgi:hypothetical protein